MMENKIKINMRISMGFSYKFSIKHFSESMIFEYIDKFWSNVMGNQQALIIRSVLKLNFFLYKIDSTVIHFAGVYR